MKRYIRAANREDILRRKADYEENRSKRRELYDRQAEMYRTAVVDAANTLRDIVYSKLPDKELDVAVYSSVENHFRVEINNDSEYHTGEVSLRWNYVAELDLDGNLKTETNSWSGLQATTEHNIADLKKTVATLEVLTNLDWKTILENATAPRYRDYVTERNPDWDDDVPDFDRELLEADIEDIIGEPILAKGKDNRGVSVYYGFVKENPKSYTVFTVPAYYVEEGKLDVDALDSIFRRNTQLRKQDLLKRINNPIETVEVPQ